MCSSGLKYFFVCYRSAFLCRLVKPIASLPVVVKRLRRFASGIAMRGEGHDLQQFLGAQSAKLSVHSGRRQFFHRWRFMEEVHLSS